jgi:hypothetical protein
MSNSAQVLIVVAAVIFLACAGVYAAGRFAQRRLKETNPNSRYLKTLGWPRIVQPISFITILFVAFSVVFVAPTSSASDFLHTWYGWVCVIVAAYMVSVVATASLKVYVSPLTTPASKDLAADVNARPSKPDHG